jgi:hypothetical protein
MIAIFPCNFLAIAIPDMTRFKEPLGPMLERVANQHH